MSAPVLRPDLRAAVDELVPIIDSDRAAADVRGRLCTELIECADSRGLFATRVPASLGGRDVSLVEQFELSEALSYVDGSVGWTLSFMALSAGLVAGHVSDEGAREICDSNAGRWPRISGTFPTTGIATRVAGGWSISGRWGFASGIDHSKWIAIGTRLAGAPPDDRTALLWAVLPVDHACIIDGTWNVDGLRATGSRTFTIDKVFVPEARAFSITDGSTTESEGRGSFVHRLPTLVFISPEHAGVALGLARRALDEVIALAKGKARMGGRAPLHARGVFLRDIGRADTRLRAARALIVDRLGDGDAARAPMPLDYVTDVRAAAAHVADVAVDVATLAYRFAGGSAIDRDHPLHRAWRDAVTATQHVHTNDENYETWGETISGFAANG
jgi:alkylation response protein AidB-like acyl-CoA dehydrogenase